MHKHQLTISLLGVVAASKGPQDGTTNMCIDDTVKLSSSSRLHSQHSATRVVHRLFVQDRPARYRPPSHPPQLIALYTWHRTSRVHSGPMDRQTEEHHGAGAVYYASAIEQQ